MEETRDDTKNAAKQPKGCANATDGIGAARMGKFVGVLCVQSTQQHWE